MTAPLAYPLTAGGNGGGLSRSCFHIAFETSSPQVAQALAAAGHGVAVVSDDPRYDLHPLGITTPDGPLHIDLYAAWDPAHYAVDVIASFADRLSRFCVDRYGAAAAPPRPRSSPVAGRR
jgi:DNA-binding transcriptional LysR family regulator